MTETRGSILGTRVIRVEDPKFLTVGGSYIADLDLPGALHVTYVRATVAHARILSVDVDEARRAPGVVAVFTAADLDDLPPAPPPLPYLDQRMVRPYLAAGTVRFVGEPIVAILSETRTQGADAAELVFVDHEPLDVLVDFEHAIASPVVLFTEAGSNLVHENPPANDPAFFDGCDVTVTARLENTKMAVAPLEPRSCAATWEDDRLVHWSCSQGAHGIRTGMATRLGLEPAQVRVIVPDVGGGFGGKVGLYPEEVLVCWFAKRLRRPVRWTETRTEHMTAFAHARGQIQYATLGGTADGRLLAYKLHVVQDCGAYPSNFGGLMPMMTRTMASGCYAIDKVDYSSQSVVTNTNPVGAFRGAGRPEAAAAIERMIDLFAHEAGLDATDVRRTNFIRPEQFPYTTQTGASYDVGAYESAMDLAIASIDLPALRAEQAARRAAHDPVLMGIGMATYVEITNPAGGGEFGAIEVHDDGSATVRTGSSPHGQGHATAWAMIAQDLTGIPMAQIRLVYGDTDIIPRGNGTGGSRSLQAGGSAVKCATEALVELARQRAADRLEARVDDVVLDTTAGAFHVAGTPSRALGWAELAGGSENDPLSAEFDFVPGGATFPFGTQIAVVDVDTETGHVTLRRLLGVDDAGRILNPLLLDGQIHGGMASGVAQALLEEIRYDVDGNPLTSNFADYGIISMTELPSFELHEHETPTPRNPLGAKGIGESGTIGATPAVQNAVCDALAHLGITHVDMPFTPERMWRVLHA
jgi:aerobic carbon-monoxide dehydrogenase large subunit